MREVLKEEIEGLFLSARGRVFQQLGAVTEKAREPKESCAWDLEAERVGGGAQRTGRVVCVKSMRKIVLSRTPPWFLTVVDRFMDVVSSSCVSAVGSCESF